MEPGVLGFGIRNPTYDWIQNQVPLTEIGIQYLGFRIYGVVSRIENCFGFPQSRSRSFCTATGITNCTKVTEALGTRLGFRTLGARDFPCVVSGFGQDFGGHRCIPSHAIPLYGAKYAVLL